MISFFKPKAKAKAELIARNQLRSGFFIGGIFEVTCFDPNGNVKWVDINHNVFTAEGLDHVLDVILHGVTAIDPWYVVVFEDDFTPDGDETYAVPGYTECEAYDESTRPEYVEAASSSQSVTNSSNKAEFTINASKTIYGAALVGGGTGEDTKGDTAGGGTLLCAERFTASRAVLDDDTLQVTYTITAADDGA